MRVATVKEQNVEIAHNDAGVRDTARTLKNGINTLIRTLKNSRPADNFCAYRSRGCCPYL